MTDFEISKRSFGGLLDDLHLTKSALADLLGVSLEDMDETLPLSAPAVPQRVRDFSEIINATVPWAGSIPQALAWFTNQPLPSLANQTAADLLRLGRVDTVKTHIERITVGGYT